MEGARSGQWDVAFLAIDPSREKDLEFSAPYMLVEVGYVVLGASPIKSMADIDRPGVRVAVAKSGGTDIVLSQILKRGVVVRADTLTVAIEMLRQGKVDAMAANKPTLFAESMHIPASRVLEGSFTTVQYAMVTPKGNSAAMAHVRKFVEAAKADGTVKAALEKAKLRGAVVAPLQ